MGVWTDQIECRRWRGGRGEGMRRGISCVFVSFNSVEGQLVFFPPLSPWTLKLLGRGGKFHRSEGSRILALQKCRSAAKCRTTYAKPGILQFCLPVNLSTFLSVNVTLSISIQNHHPSTPCFGIRLQETRKPGSQEANQCSLFEQKPGLPLPTHVDFGQTPGYARRPVNLEHI